ncbi:four-carbon acid sugar kinase family protein [Klebsiella pneumoniae]|uniref:four-carbon acid sugar kinase family protein n=1 Tax=Klebsiella pneumoniae TaxID=573 RepID=UPI001BA49437|nr:four-carbon acid sugar kinase family protein [Klebsiella pneumoniae]MBQ5265167.1 four-carbon acid sugar kinase family protein [Klebsiella pneumoniae]
MSCEDKPKMRLVFYGDDFTGSSDSLEVLAAAGLKCALFLTPPSRTLLRSLGDFDAIGIAGDSRSMSPSDMDAELKNVFESIKELSPDIIHYKVCSTFDSSPEVGSIGHVMGIASAVFAQRSIPVVAGNPALKRYCVFGNLYAYSRTDNAVHRIDRHPVMSIHPITPMLESDLTRHIQQQRDMTFATIDVSQLDSEADLLELTNTLSSDHEAVLIDGLTTKHLTQAGEIIDRMSRASSSLFVVGSSGVEYGLTQYWRSTGTSFLNAEVSPVLKLAKQVLVVSGSASPLSKIQIERAIQAGYVEFAVDATALLADVEGEYNEGLVIDAIVRALKNGSSVIIHTAKGSDDPRIKDMVNFMVNKGKTTEEAKIQGGKLIALKMGSVVKNILKQYRPDRLVISGGDTSSQITKILEPDALKIESLFSPGAPLCRALSSEAFLSELEIALKGGQMGDQDYFVKAMKGDLSTTGEIAN